jgi:ABC-type branched-subunit amino acid transport system ATPase component
VLKPTYGSVRFAGESLIGLSVPRVCQRRIARTFQLTALFPQMSARENRRGRFTKRV